jgi:sulfoxide reductase heme-binding subunit YedZ
MTKRLSWLRRNWLRVSANVVALATLAALLLTYASGGFAIDPVKETTIRTGRLAITFLLLSLACTPVAVITGLNRIRRARRPWGLWALAYTVLHFLIFAGWDYRFDLPLLWTGIAYQPFVVVGSASLLILLVLGVTSLPGLRTKLGKSWIWVQRMVYVAAVLDVWHVLWLKKNPAEAWWYPFILAVLLLVRVPLIRKAISRLRKAMARSQTGKVAG